MPLKRMAQKMARKLMCLGPQESEEAEPIAIQPRLEPDEAHAVEPGRPYQDYVESEARRYWQSLVGRDSLTIGKGSLTKPDQEELRTAAMPILCLALRNRPGHRRHQATAAMVQHAFERGWIKPPFSETYESPSYIDALIELVKDARWIVSLEETRDELKQAMLWKLSVATIPPQEESEIQQGVLATASIDRLCELYDRLTRKERQAGRGRRSYVHELFLAMEVDVKPPYAAATTFALGGKLNLDAEAVEEEIRQYLRAFCHPFISQAVYDMEFGYSEAVEGYPGLLHASDGIYGVGNCSILYYEDAEHNLIRIVGIAYLDGDIYRLVYASGELGGSRHMPGVPYREYKRFTG